MANVLATREFDAWFASLVAADRTAVAISINVLQMAGVALSYPASSAIRDSKISLRELRPTGGRSPLRVFYAFDPARDAVLLIGGNKASDKKFYERMVRQSEAIWSKYLAAKFPAKKR